MQEERHALVGDLALPALMASLSTPSATEDNLRGAFQLFLDASAALEEQQQRLLDQVERLSADLTVANERLRDEIAEKTGLAERMRALLEALPAGVIVIEFGAVVEFNPAAGQMIPGLQAGHAWCIPEDWTRIGDSDDFETGSGSQRRVFKLRAAEAGKRSILQLVDITETVQARERHEREAKLMAMGRMAAEMAHQLRTPLATALLYASHLCNSTLGEQDRPLFAQRLRDQLVALERMASTMLTFVRERPKQQTVVGIGAVINDAAEAVRPLCAQRSVELELAVEASDSVLTVNREQVSGALVALLENALEVSSPGQTIRLSSRVDSQRVVISVEDHGPGIEPAMMERLFEPFATSRATGTGLGLSIARNAIEAHRGEIRAENRPDGGARFLLTLPCLSML